MGWPFTTMISNMNRTNPGRICTGNPRMRMGGCYGKRDHRWRGETTTS
jgi:hypothetical protein